MLVVGAGPAGLTAATKLAQKGISVRLLESADHVGGMARSFELWNRTIDVGPHRFFSQDPRVNSFWLEAVGIEFHMVKRKTRILHDGKFFDYPLRATNALRNLGLFQALWALASYVKARLFPVKDTSTFEGWVVNRFGRRLFEIFFRSYTEKLWGIPCDRLDSDFAAQRIKNFSLGEALKSALRPRGSQKHRTLVDEFAYPNFGAGFPYASMREQLELSGARVELNQRVISVERATDGWVVSSASGEVYEVKNIISTMPLTLLVRMLDAPADVLEASSQLRFRNTVLVYALVDGGSLFEDQWLYIQSNKMRTGRITNFNNWGLKQDGDSDTTILALEYWCFDDDELWDADDAEFASMVRSDLEIAGIAKPLDVKQTSVLRVPKCYPVYDSGYQQHLAKVQDFIDAQVGLSVIGRYGSFKYNNQDHSILMGLLAAENLADQAGHDLWGVNADQEYQEGSLISETGLVFKDDQR